MSFVSGLFVGLVVGALVADFAWAKATGNLGVVLRNLRRLFKLS